MLQRRVKEKGPGGSGAKADVTTYDAPTSGLMHPPGDDARSGKRCSPVGFLVAFSQPRARTDVERDYIQISIGRAVAAILGIKCELWATRGEAGKCVPNAVAFCA